MADSLAQRPSGQYSSRNITLIRGPADAAFGTQCCQVRWHVPPSTSRSPRPV